MYSLLKKFSISMVPSQHSGQAIEYKERSLPADRRSTGKDRRLEIYIFLIHNIVVINKRQGW
jgi:hypothetical protein